MKRFMAFLAVSLLFLAACMPTPEQQRVVTLVNQTRAAHWIGPLHENATARNKAQDWANWLAYCNCLYHSYLPSGMDAVAWTTIGENVGRGGSIEAVHRALMESPSHKANVLGSWCCIGAGVARSADGTFYVVQVFFRT